MELMLRKMTAFTDFSLLKILDHTPICKSFNVCVVKKCKGHQQLEVHCHKVKHLSFHQHTYSRYFVKFAMSFFLILTLCLQK